jgi:uncharacterized membrane protein YjdF
MQIPVCRVQTWLLSLALGFEKITEFEIGMITNIGEGLQRRSLIGCILLALLDTAISLSLSMLTGQMAAKSQLECGDSARETRCWH